MHFQKIMHDAVESPLDADLLFSSQAEAIQAQARSDIGEDRLDRRNPSTIFKLTGYRIDLFPHLLREGLIFLFGLAREMGELTCLGHVGML